jgi:hypothetical protein
MQEVKQCINAHNHHDIAIIPIFFSQYHTDAPAQLCTEKVHVMSFSISKHCTKRVIAYLCEDFS